MTKCLLKDKPFYFLTDRESQISFFVDQSDKDRAPASCVYYPDEYQTMTGRQIEVHKYRLTLRMLWFSLFDRTMMKELDRKICHSRIIDTAVAFGLILLSAKSLRKFLFQIKTVELDLLLQGSVINSRWAKSVFAYGCAATVMSVTLLTNVKNNYLNDLAYEYQYAFMKGKVLSSPANDSFYRLSALRFGQVL